MWNLVLYIVAVIVGLVLYHLYDESEQSEECARQIEAGNSSDMGVKSSVTDFRFCSLFSALGFSVPGDTLDERFESFTEHFSTFDEVLSLFVVTL